MRADARFCRLLRAEISARSCRAYSRCGTHCAIIPAVRLTLLIAICQYSHIADMEFPLHRPKCLRLKILPVNPYNSEILMLTRPEIHCFHRPGGRGVPPSKLGAARFGGWRNRAIARRAKMRYEPGRSSPRHSPVQCRTFFRSSRGIGGRMARSSRGR
jgi:hypothetical protein